MRRALAIGCLVIAGVSPAAASAQDRLGDMPDRIARLTNARYDHDCFWGGPRGADYERLPDIQEIQKPNLYPDTGAHYFAGQFRLPAGATLTFDGRFPYARYLSYAIQSQLPGRGLGSGDVVRDDQIVARRGSVNPFVVGHRRDGRRRAYRVRVVAGPVPASRPANTLYTGSTDPAARVTLVLRHYIPDRGRDGTGDAGLPRLTLRVADGAAQRGAAACRTLEVVKEQSNATFPTQPWKDLVAGSSDPASAPALRVPRWDRFWNVGYSVLGSFVDDQAERARRHPATDEGGFASNPDTRYLINAASLRFGRVFTITGRMPSVPRTYPASTTMTRHDLRYWSVCTGSAPTSGLGYDCVFDQQVPLRGRRYTIVVSRPADRPRNARVACGYRWLDFGDGESHPDGTGRASFSTLYMRFVAPTRRWHQAPHGVKAPGTEPAVMGPYLPRSAYTSKSGFERRGCKAAP